MIAAGLVATGVALGILVAYLVSVLVENIREERRDRAELDQWFNNRNKGASFE